MTSTYRDCSANGQDTGTWTYTPSGSFAQPGNPTYTGTYSFQYTITPTDPGSGMYQGTEDFVDTSGGKAHQAFSVPVHFGANCLATPSGAWSVHVTGSGDLAFLTGG
jgi:hypothetical protein